MPEIPRQPDVVRFDSYEIHLPTQELFKHGTRIKFPPQAFRVLQMLLDRPGQLVTREEFHRALWPTDTFVDFDQGLNNAIKKIRDALSDSAETPRYIETLPRLGYRFIGQLKGSNGFSDQVIAVHKPSAAENGNNGNGSHPEVSHLEQVIHRASATDHQGLYTNGAEAREYLLRLKTSPVSQRSWRIVVAASLVLFAVGGAILWQVKRGSSVPPALNQRILTDASSEKPIWDAAISPDGKYLAYADNRKMYLKVLATGDTRDLPQPEGLENGVLGPWSLGGWFPESSRFVANMHGSQGNTSIWIVSVLGTPPHKIRDYAEAYAVSPDGALIAFTAGGIWLMDSNGEHAKSFLQAPGNRFIYTDIQWSPDGRRIAYKFTHLEEAPSPAEISIQTRDLNAQSLTTVLSDTPFNDFRWLPDGRVLFTRGSEETDSPACNLWQLHIDSRTGLPKDKPRQLTNWEGMGFDSLSSTADGKRLAYVRHTNTMSIYVSEFDSVQRRVSSLRRLTTTQSWDFPFDWTPDGNAVIFMSHRRGHWNIYKQALHKDFPEMIVAGVKGTEAIEPKLSPDGEWLIYTEHGDPKTPGQPPSNRIMRIPLAGGPSEFIFKPQNHFGTSCSRVPATLCVFAEVSSDGTQLIFSAFDPFRGPGMELIRMSYNPKINYCWHLSPNGKKIYYVEPGTPSIHVLPLDQTTPYEIRVHGWPGFTSVSSAANSDGYFVNTMTSGGITLLFVEPSGKAHALLKNGSDRNWGVASRGGRHLATMDESADGNVWVAENF